MVLSAVAFILLHLFTHSKPTMTAINTMRRKRSGSVTPTATGVELCASIVSGGGFVAMVGKGNGIVTVAVTDERKVNTLVGTVEQVIHMRYILFFVLHLYPT